MTASPRLCLGRRSMMSQGKVAEEYGKQFDLSSGDNEYPVIRWEVSVSVGWTDRHTRLQYQHGKVGNYPEDPDPPETQHSTCWSEDVYQYHQSFLWTTAGFCYHLNLPLSHSLDKDIKLINKQKKKQLTVQTFTHFKFLLRSYFQCKCDDDACHLILCVTL